MIRAIQTHYKGYHFRSRLEARWAVFFDAAGIKWEYEKEGYKFFDYNYLSDFYLPEFDCFFEVKGDQNYDKNMLSLFAPSVNKILFVACGEIPDPQESTCGETLGMICFPCVPSEDHHVNETGKILAWDNLNMFLQCDDCGKIEIMGEAYSGMKEMCKCHKSRMEPLSKALEKARSARFEHAQS